MSRYIVECRNKNIKFGTNSLDEAKREWRSIVSRLTDEFISKHFYVNNQSSRNAAWDRFLAENPVDIYTNGDCNYFYKFDGAITDDDKAGMCWVSARKLNKMGFSI